MTQTTKAPQLQDLFLDFLNRSIDGESLKSEVAALDEVEPHEVAVGFRAEPKLAWQEGLEAIAAQTNAIVVTAPPEWAGMVVRHSSLPALPFAAANYPQRVRDLSVLLETKDLARLSPHGEQTTVRPAPGSVRSWAAKQIQKRELGSGLAAVGVLRSAQDYDLAAEYLETLGAIAGPEDRAALENERAAILWQRGEAEAAWAVWTAAPDSTPVFFNRGMAALFLNQPTAARASLVKAVEGMTDASPWQHLASLYLALSEIRK